MDRNQTQTTQTETEQVLQQAQKLASDLTSARLNGLTDERIATLNRDAKALCRQIRQG